MARRHYVNNAPRQTLSAQITSGATSCSVAGTFAGWPTQFPFTAELDKDTASAEVVLVTNIVGTTATITRGYDGTAAISHAAGATLDFVVVSEDFDEANAHINSNTGVHGVSGSLVGTSDAQTLTNKTLSAPILDGNVTSTDGTVNVSGAIAVTGASSAASYAANGDGHVSGVVVVKGYTNEAAATAAGANATGAVVYLTAPTGGGAGHYEYDGTNWLQLRAGQPFTGESESTTPVTLSTTSAFAGSAVFTFTLARQTRVKITGVARYNPGSSGGNCRFQAGYNSGSSAVIGSFTGVGQIWNTSSSDAKAESGIGVGTALLAAGTYTAYLSATRVGGAATDTVDNFSILVEALGNV